MPAQHYTNLPYRCTWGLHSTQVIEAYTHICGACPWHAVPMLTVCDQQMSTLQLMTSTRSLVTGHRHVGYWKKVVLCFMDVLCTSTLKGAVCLYITIYNAQRMTLWTSSQKGLNANTLQYGAWVIHLYLHNFLIPRLGTTCQGYASTNTYLYRTVDYICTCITFSYRYEPVQQDSWSVFITTKYTLLAPQMTTLCWLHTTKLPNLDTSVNSSTGVHNHS